MTGAPPEKSKPLYWDATSQDYLQHRPGYPAEFFALLQQLGIGMAGQDILDLGAGTGALSVPFAKQGARVTAVDCSEGQIKAAQQAARRQGVEIAFKVAPAEATGLPDHSFNVISASMCWLYFDIHRMETEVPRLLRPEGLLLVSYLIWAPNAPIAAESEALIAVHNPEAHREDRRKREPEIVPDWSRNRFRLRTYHHFKVDMPFTRESWRGRLRACKWIGAALTPEQTLAFDREHEALLERIAPEQFNIPHHIQIQVFQPSQD